MAARPHWVGPPPPPPPPLPPPPPPPGYEGASSPAPPALRLLVYALAHLGFVAALDAAARTHPAVEWTLVALAGTLVWLECTLAPRRSALFAPLHTVWFAHLALGVLWRAHWMHHPGIEDLAHPVVRAAHGLGLYALALALGVPFLWRPDIAPVLLAAALLLRVGVPPPAPAPLAVLLAQTLALEVCVGAACVVLRRSPPPSSGVPSPHAAPPHGADTSDAVVVVAVGAAAPWCSAAVLGAASAAAATQGLWTACVTAPFTLAVGSTIQMALLALYVAKTQHTGRLAWALFTPEVFCAACSGPLFNDVWLLPPPPPRWMDPARHGAARDAAALCEAGLAAAGHAVQRGTTHYVGIDADVDSHLYNHGDDDDVGAGLPQRGAAWGGATSLHSPAPPPPRWVDPAPQPPLGVQFAEPPPWGGTPPPVSARFLQPPAPPSHAAARPSGAALGGPASPPPAATAQTGGRAVQLHSGTAAAGNNAGAAPPDAKEAKRAQRLASIERAEQQRRSAGDGGGAAAAAVQMGAVHSAGVQRSGGGSTMRSASAEFSLAQTAAPPHGAAANSEVMRLRAQLAQYAAQFRQLERRFARQQREMDADYAVLCAEVWRHRTCNINAEAPTPLLTSPLELAATQSLPSAAPPGTTTTSAAQA